MGAVYSHNSQGAGEAGVVSCQSHRVSGAAGGRRGGDVFHWLSLKQHEAAGSMTECSGNLKFQSFTRVPPLLSGWGAEPDKKRAVARSYPVVMVMVA